VALSLDVAAQEEKTTECKEIKTALSANNTLAISNFNQNTPFAMRQRCITQILTQPAVRVNFTLFKQWIQTIITMDITNQQEHSTSPFLP
jgi:hypothetical protein